MWLFSFYRLYLSICAGILLWLFLAKSIWLSILTAIAVRAVWFLAEKILDRIMVERDFRHHVYAFKQQLGPYGIRIANQAEKDFGTKKSLAEVFVANRGTLRKNVDQIKVLDTLFSAGMRPEGDAWLLHDCKLKYGLFRMQKEEEKKRRP